MRATGVARACSWVTNVPACRCCPCAGHPAQDDRERAGPGGEAGPGGGGLVKEWLDQKQTAEEGGGQLRQESTGRGEELDQARLQCPEGREGGRWGSVIDMHRLAAPTPCSWWTRATTCPWPASCSTSRRGKPTAAVSSCERGGRDGRPMLPHGHQSAVLRCLSQVAPLARPSPLTPLD